MLSLSSSLPPLVGGGDGLVCESVGIRLISCQIILTASSPMSLLICRSLAIRLFDLSLPPLTFAFRSISEVRRLLFDLDHCGGTDPLGMFSLFLKRTADVQAVFFLV